MFSSQSKRGSALVKGRTMELFGSQWVRQCEHLAQVSRRLPGGGLLGRRPARLPAGGTELTGYRDYAAGDDYRQVDWKQCARHDELLTKQFEGETDLRVYILLDVSRSMALGHPPKFDVARRIAAALAYVALTRLQTVGITTFADGVVADCPPIGQRAEYLKILDFLKGSSPIGKASILKRAAEPLVARYQRRGLAVVISDLYDPAGFQHGIDVLHFDGYRAAIVQVYDPAESCPPALGDLECFDVESGATLQVTVTERMRTRYCALFDDFQHAVRDHCASRDVPCAQIPADWPEDEQLLAAIGAKETGGRKKGRGPTRAKRPSGRSVRSDPSPSFFV